MRPRYCGSAKRTLEDHAKANDFESFVRCRRRLIKRESLDAWIEGSASDDGAHSIDVMQTDPFPGWFSVKGAAEYTDFSVSAIEKALRLGHIKSKAVRFDGERVSRRIKREWLDAWIEERDPDDPNHPALVDSVLWSPQMLAKRWAMGEREVLRMYQAGAFTAEISEPGLYRFDVNKVETQLRDRAGERPDSEAN